jgi:hypothetical protein
MPGPFESLRKFFSNQVVLAPEKQQRFAQPHHHVFYLRN